MSLPLDEDDPGSTKSGLAGAGPGEKPETIVRLVRPGVGVQEYHLPGGATLADLLRRSGATTTNQIVYIDGIMAGESATLHHGAVVMIVPRPRNGSIEEPWRATISSFRDEELFRQYAEAVKARRRDLGPNEVPGA
jgi:hypothetical protein